MTRTLLATASVACVMSASIASAASLDFIGFANGNEHGVANGTTINFDGVDVTFNAGLAGATEPNSAFAYFDSKNAGLGVCKFGDFGGGQTNAGNGNTCLNANGGQNAGDDNITETEFVTLTLDGAYTLSNLLFTGEYHNGTSPGDIEYLHLETDQDIADDNGAPSPRFDMTLLFGTNGGDLERYTFAELVTLSFENVTSFTLAFDDDNVGNSQIPSQAEQFYLASAVVSPVPVPAALPLLLAGVGGLGFMARRKRKAA